MLYITLMLLCSIFSMGWVTLYIPFFNKKISLNYADTIYPITFILVNTIAFFSIYRFVFILMVISLITQLIFIFVIYYVSTLSIPLSITSNETLLAKAIDIVAITMVNLFYKKLIFITLINFVEVFIFFTLNHMYKNFFLSSLISLFVAICCINSIYDFEIYKVAINIGEKLFTEIYIGLFYITLFSLITKYILKHTIKVG